MDIEKIKTLANRLGDETDTDILLYSGKIERPYDEHVINACCNAKRRNNVLLMLCTYGGDPDVGYRIARVLQNKYKKFSVLIDGACKSAGTLITVGAHEVIISNHGEIGPLDIQLGKKDELWETDSGLTILKSIETLEQKAFDLFEACFLKLKARSSGQITLKTATEIASKLAIGTITPIVSQIDPMHVGEVSRAMNIGLEYAQRLANHSNNTDRARLEYLANAYPSHGFVIDGKEARDIFDNVRDLSESESELVNALGYIIRRPSADSIFAYLSEEFKELKNENSHQRDNIEGTESVGPSIPSDEGVSREANVSSIRVKSKPKPRKKASTQ